MLSSGCTGSFNNVVPRKVSPDVPAAPVTAAAPQVVPVEGQPSLLQEEPPVAPKPCDIGTSHEVAPTTAETLYLQVSKNAWLYVPKGFHPVKNEEKCTYTYNVIFHFHGGRTAENLKASGVNAVIVGVGVGGLSSVYREKFKDPEVFLTLMKDTQRVMEQKGYAAGSTMGEVALSSWSAGYAAIGEILKQPGMAARVSAVLLADGLHTNYVGKREVDMEALQPFTTFAQRAKSGETVFAFTHSSILPPDYPGTTEIAQTLLSAVGVEKGPPKRVKLKDQSEIYEAHSGGLHIMGFRGGEVTHDYHAAAMGVLLFSRLGDRWGWREPVASPAPSPPRHSPGF
jgi:hypothetical protein